LDLDILAVLVVLVVLVVLDNNVDKIVADVFLMGKASGVVGSGYTDSFLPLYLLHHQK